MAYLSKNLERLTGSDGTPLDGGKLRVYRANTLTLADLFATTGLATPVANPIVADAAGILDIAFLASGNYDIAVLTSGDVVLDAWDDVPAIGADEAVLFRDFGNSRFQVRGSGGTVYVEAGDADPDNIGGVGRLGGWAGTQAVSWTVDAALLNTTGRFTENSKKLPGIVYTPATPFTTAANVPIQLPNDPAGTTIYDIDIWELFQSGSDDLVIQFSYDGGAVYKTTAADYLWLRAFYGTSSAHTVGTASAGAGSAYIQLMSGTTGAANKPASFRLRIYTPDSGSNYTKATWRGEGLGASETYVVNGMGQGATGLGRCTHIRLDTSGTNTLTGKYRMVPVRGTGDA